MNSTLTKTLKLNPILFALFILILSGAQSCFHKVARVDEDIDLSGRWNDVDSRITSEAMVEQVLEGDWLKDFMLKEKAQPVVIIGMVVNKSYEHIDAEMFMKDIEKAFIGSNKVRLVQGAEKRDEIRKERTDQQNYSSATTMKKWGLEIGADYMMQGTISSIVDQYKRKKVVYYQIDLELTHLETNEVVWIGDKKIKKFIKN